jgi:hypothetical protein
MIYETITETQFMDAFKAIRPNNFSYEGLSALYDYLEELSEDEPVELDVIAICCEFTEYNSLDEMRADHPTMPADDQEATEWLDYRTLFLNLPRGGYIIQNF